MPSSLSVRPERPSEDKCINAWSNKKSITYCRYHIIVFISQPQFGEDQRLLHSFSFRDNDTFEALKQGMLNLCYIELGKEPPKQLRQWVNFFNGRPIVEDAPEYIKQAYQLVDYANLSDKERKMISAAERKEQDFIGYINFARKEGRAEGRAEVALNLLDADMSVADIARLTGLTEQEIQRLAKACHLQR